MKQVKLPGDIPQGAHFAIMIYKIKNIYHEGDERSRTNPGHDYPAHTENILTIEHWVTQNESLLQAKVEELSGPKGYGSTIPLFVVLEVAKKLNVVTRTTISME